MKRKPTRQSAPTRAAIYSRFSTDEQAKQAVTSCDAQEATATPFALECGYQVVAMIRDEGRSGTTHARPGLRQLLALAEAGEIDVVVVTRMDRLGRGQVFVEARRDLHRAGVQVETALERFGAGIAGYMEEQVRLLVGGMYAPMIAEHTRAKMQDMARRGLWLGGRVPVGLRIETIGEGEQALRYPRIDEAGAQIVRDAFALFLQTEDRGAVQAFLVEATGRGWRPHQVREFLSHRLYLGDLHWGEVVVPGYCPAILDEATFRAAAAVLARGARPKGTPREIRPDAVGEPWWLTGSFRCGSCGGSMTSYWARSKGREYRYYECTNAARGICDQPRLSAPRVHDLVLGETFSAIETPWKLRSTLAAAAATGPDLSALERETRRALRARNAAREQSRRIRQAIAACRSDGAIAGLAADLEKLADAEARAEVELEQARRAQHEAKAPTAEELWETLSRARELWRYATEEEKKEMVRLLIGSPTATGRRVTWNLCLCHLGAPGVIRGGEPNTLPTRLLLETSRPSVPLSGTVAATGRVARRGGW